MKLLLVSISIILYLPNFFKFSPGKIPQYDHKENFDQKLSYINSLDKLLFVSDSIAQNKNVKQASLQYAVIVNNIISNRFYHGFSHFTPDKNWLAVAGEYCFGHDLSCTVKADDILKYNYAGCSQQSIVLMEAMKRKNISYRSAGFPHHYAVELNLEGHWYYFDANMEPVMTDSERLQKDLVFSADTLKKYYDRKRFTDLDWKLGNANIIEGKENAVVAANAKMFQATTFYLSKTLWIFPLLIAFVRRKNLAASQK